MLLDLRYIYLRNLMHLTDVKYMINNQKGSVAKKIFLHFDTIILTFMCHFLSNEND
jgi:hypothetical protein